MALSILCNALDKYHTDYIVSLLVELYLCPIKFHDHGPWARPTIAKVAEVTVHKLFSSIGLDRVSFVPCDFLSEKGEEHHCKGVVTRNMENSM